MLDRFTIKEGLTMTLIIDLLSKILAKKAAVEEVLIERFAEVNGVTREQIKDDLDLAEARHLEKIGHYLFAEYGNIDIDDIIEKK